MEPRNTAHDTRPPQRLVGLAAARQGKLALVLAGPAHWHDTSAYTFMPAAIPGSPLDAAGLGATLDTLAHRAFGCPVHIVSSRCVYGPSAAHAIDRLQREPSESPAPLLRLERGTPLEAGDDVPPEPLEPLEPPVLRRVELRTYLARLEGEPAASGGPREAAGAGILWIAPAALRAVMRGMPLADALALPGVAWQPAPAVTLPDEPFVYVPGDYGERHLVRIAAKYGPEALFQDGAGH